MKIDAVDFFYLSMPVVVDVADGSQDALLVRVRAGDRFGWGECEAAPLVSIASWVCPMSHAACKPVSASVIGQCVDSVADIERVHALVRRNSLDLLQSDHTLSGVDIALWDLLGRKLETPIYRLLGQRTAHAKRAYASQLFGDDPETTYQRAVAARDAGYSVVKFGWGPYGRGDPGEDAELVRAARDGLGADGTLLVDAGTVWENDVDAARQRLASLERSGVMWLEEPFHPEAVGAYRELAAASGEVRIAGGEGCHDARQAIRMIDEAGLGFIQIDAGRVGGITSARRVVSHASAHGIQYVNHTFTTQLALSASIQPYAGLAEHEFCEVPFAPSELARTLTRETLAPDENGRIRAPDRPGLGLEPDTSVLARYLVDVTIQVDGKTIYCTPDVQG